MIARWLRIVGAYIAACVAASVAVAVVIVFLGLAKGKPPSFDGFLWTIRVGIVLTASYAFVPAAVIIAVAEAFRLRRAAFYGAAGVLAAAAAWGLLRPPLQVSALLQHMRDLLLIGPGGLVGGLVYWWIAGRSAGAGRGAPLAAP